MTRYLASGASGARSNQDEVENENTHAVRKSEKKG